MLMVLAVVLLVGMVVSTFADDQVGSGPGVLIPMATILATPEQYEGKEVVIRGKVVGANRATFPNGRLYYTLSIENGGTAITVFSWEGLTVRPGDYVQAEGTFHVWRYGIHHMIEGRRIIPI